MSEMNEEKEMSKEREGSSLWNAGFWAQKEKCCTGVWCTHLQMATRGEEAMCGSVFSRLKEKRQFLTEWKKHDFNARGGGKGGKNQQPTAYLFSLSFSSHSSFILCLQLACECKWYH